MSTRTPSPDVTVIGYGSLMSGLGLLPGGRLRMRAATRVALANARRGFGKFSQRGDHFAMLLEPVDAAEPLAAHSLGAQTAPGQALEGIAYVVAPNDFAGLCDREGYSSGAVQRLRQEAQARGQDLAAFLWSMLADAGFDTAQFRQQLFKLVSYTSPHYIPHPLRLDDTGVAVTFLAPGREGTGSERVVAVRLRTATEELMTITEAWRRKPNRIQLTYFAACLLGGAHGVCVRDVLEPLAVDGELAERVGDLLADEQRHELPRFLDLTGIEHSAYWQAFGAPTHSARRSGLEQFLKSRGLPRARADLRA